MPIPVWSLLGFAGWTVILLLFTVGIYRWSRVLTGRAALTAFPADKVEGADWYKRSMRAHANCIENLPVFGAIVFVIYITGAGSAAIDGLCVLILIARVLQSLVHVSAPQTNAIILVRFIFFFAQLLAFLALIILVVSHVL